MIKALEDTVPAAKTPFAEAKESIEQQLLEERRNAAMSTWVEQVRGKYASQVAYAVGFAPPAAASTSAGSGTTP